MGNSWDKLLGPPEDEGGDYNYKDLHDGCELVKRTWTWDYCKRISWQSKTMQLIKDITLDFIMSIAIDYFPSFWVSQPT